MKNKLLTQNMDPNRAKGIIFLKESDICHEIIKSKALYNFLLENFGELIDGKEVKTSIKFSFGKSLNELTTYTAINRADIYANMDPKTFNVHIIIIDTNDYNKGDKNLLVKIGHNAQEAGYLEQYFSLFILELSCKQIIKILTKQ